ncbi:MAG TPA: alpha/beta hydrolase, partial [Aquella sp.]|nr:alpha/beta hydrolase [Aquella sp.]
GGFAMQYVAYKIPQKVKGLLLFSTAMKQSEFALEYLNTRLKTLRNGISLEDSIKLFVPMIYADNFVTEDLINSIISKEKSNLYPQSTKSLEMQILACLNHDSSNICHQINVPTLIVTGALDKTIDKKSTLILAENIKNSKLEIVPGVGHMIQIESPGPFCKITIKFINETEKATHSI